MDAYRDFLDLLDGRSQERVIEFLGVKAPGFPSKRSLYELEEELQRYDSVVDRVAQLPGLVYLNLLCLDCTTMNAMLTERALELKQSLIEHVLRQNRRLIKDLTTEFGELWTL